MKTIESLQINGQTLTVLVDEKQPNKAYVFYFINGVEIKEWQKLSKLHQNLFTTLADSLCDGLSIQKWSY